jgi:DNA ligase (NAD+)
MLSLESTTDPEVVRRFDARLPTTPAERSARYVVEPKFDGLSIEVVYRRGLLDRASTRGDGDRGEGVTENVKTIRAVPLRLHGRKVPRLLAVRGEVIMRIEDFDVLNSRLRREGATTFANPRNAAAGSVRQLDSRVTARRRLDVFFYDLFHCEGGPHLTQHAQVLRALQAWGLRASPYARACATIGAVLRYREEMERRRGSLPYEIDGVVVKMNDLALRQHVQATARHPRWALAIKFAAREALTTIADIIIQVGRTGVVTPVAVLHPVAIGGVRVTRATLHNRQEIARKDLRVGDTVRVIRAGDVIPEIVERQSHAGRPRGRRFAMPGRCPVCRTRLVQDGALDRCPNGLACSAQLKRSIRHFGSRQALDIRGLGPKTVDALVETRRVRSIADLFALTRDDLIAVERFADVSAANLLHAIAKARQVPLWRFVYALGIPGVGAQTARDVAACFGTLERVRSADKQALTAIPGVGVIVARGIVEFFRQPLNRRVIDACLRRGVRVGGETVRARGPLAGRTVVFTGGLASMTREEAEARARALGARTARSVSRQTDLVVAGRDPGAKYARAQALGVRVVDEKGFRRLAESVTG